MGDRYSNINVLYIKESQGPESHKSPSPVRKVGDKETKTESPLNSDSGYFEGEEEGLKSEPSIEIIFDKNASNNNSGKSGGPSTSGRQQLTSWRQPPAFIRLIKSIPEKYDRFQKSL